MQIKVKSEKKLGLQDLTRVESTKAKKQENGSHQRLGVGAIEDILLRGHRPAVRRQVSSGDYHQ